MDNPFINDDILPNFQQMKPNYAKPAVIEVLDKHKSKIKDILNDAKVREISFDELFNSLDIINEDIHRTWGMISHLNNVNHSDEWQNVHDDLLPTVSEYMTKVSHNQELYNLFSKIKADNLNLSKVQKRMLEDTLLGFKLSGIELDEKNKKLYEELSLKLDQLQSKFQENVIKATNSYKKIIRDESLLEGIPEASKSLFKAKANKENIDGWVIGLDAPSVQTILTYSDNRELRKEIYKAFTTKASGIADYHGDDLDNSKILLGILSTRDKKAKLVGYNNYAEYVLSSRVADNPDKVFSFLNQILDKAKPKAIEEFNELKEFAKREYEINDLSSWDVGYVSEKMKEKLYDYNSEELRNYFPFPKVMQGMFTLLGKVYGIKFEEVKNPNVWDSSVILYKVTDSNNNVRGYFYADMYARDNKQAGAWMDNIYNRINNSTKYQPAVATIVGNFRPASDGKPALLSHDEVETLFHEMGHCLHHILSTVNYISVSGVNGVEWDAIEFPSQFNEGWIWTKEVLPMISGHWETGDAIPESLYKKLIASRKFQSGLFLVRQIEFGLIDFELHTNKIPENFKSVLNKVVEVRGKTSVIPIPEYNRFINSFSHIFAGGYAAGYYSYLWAEVMARDAFAAFEETSILNPDIGSRFLQTVLENGGSVKPIELFVDFRGREPNVDSLMKWYF